jgi:2-amino-4-hydroxy-6-hydroxymethyldihydropteridine diphosphokinase
MKVLISFGSNLGDKKENCKEAIRRILAVKGITILRESSFYRTEPVGKTDQDWFVNGLISVETEIPPEELMDRLLSIERTMGRVRDVKWGPRIIDLDLISCGDTVMKTEKLTLPHPEIQNRAFVLVPIRQIEPKWVHPVTGKTAGEMLNELSEGQGVQII